MSNYNTDVVYKVTKEKKGKGLELGNLYFKNVPVVYAQVHKPGKKYESEDTAYALTLFINQDTMDKVEEIGVNKEFAEVGKTKLKKGPNRGNLKFPVEGEYENYGGMYATQVKRDTVKRDKDGQITKHYAPLTVIDTEGELFTQDVGNGSVCTVKLFCYRNADDMLVMMMDTVQVIEHVPYEGGGDSFDEEMGVKIPTTQVAQEEVPAEEKSTPTTPNAPEEDEDESNPF